MIDLSKDGLSKLIKVSVMHKFLQSVDYKLQRSNEQILGLAASVEEWSARNPPECLFEDVDQGRRIIGRLKEFPEPVPLALWGLIVGEIIHNLRSTLDNLAYALSRLKDDPPQNQKKVSFPIYESKDNFQKKGRQGVSQMSQLAAELVKKIQPFNRDGTGSLGTPNQDPLIHLQWLNNIDKHQVPTVMLLCPARLRFEAEFEYESEEIASSVSNPIEEFFTGPITEGGTIMQFSFQAPIVRFNFNGGVDVRISIQMENHQEDMIVQMRKLHDYVQVVVLQFRPFFEVPNGNL